MRRLYGLILLILLAPAFLYAGALEVVSDPQGAEIILNHIRTGRVTPDTLLNLPNTTVSVSVLLEEYSFTEREVEIVEDSMSQLSFSQMIGFDTMSIVGEQLFGILRLPESPVETPYLVNQIIEDRDIVVLGAGFHRVEWDGGIGYQPIDTVVEVRPARITELDLHFSYRYGRIDIETVPDSAIIFVDTMVWGIGSVNKPLNAGSHSLRIVSERYKTHEEPLLLFPGQVYRDTILLEELPDNDGDGFDDSVDLCVNIYGTYDGCPEIQKGREFRRIGSHLGETFLSAPLTFEFAPFSFKNRIATSGDFNQLVALFNDGSSLLNNYRGVSLLHKMWLSKGLFIGSVDYDYSLSGLRYEKEWDIPVNSDSSQYLHYDEFANENPVMRIFSVNVQAGIQLSGDLFSFAVLAGYMYETISTDGISEFNRDTGKTKKISKKDENSNVNTTVRATIKLKDVPLYPRIYGEMSFTGSRGDVTGWIQSSLGVTIPIWNNSSSSSESEN